MTTNTQSSTTDLDYPAELQKATRSIRLRTLDDLEVDTEKAYLQTKATVLAELRRQHKDAPAPTLNAWADRDRAVIKAHHRLVKIRADRDSIRNSDPASIEPSGGELRAARATCESRRRAWGRFTRKLDHEVGRRRAWRRRQNLPTRTTGRSSRPSTSTRTRGSKRTTRTSSSSGGGDSGSSGDPDPAGVAHPGREHQNEHEERRYCRGCGLRLVDKAPQARDHGPACTARWRRRGKKDAPWVDGVEYGPGVETAAEIERAIRSYQQTTYRHESVDSDTTLAEVLELVEVALEDRRKAWQGGDRWQALAIEGDLYRLWHEVRVRREKEPLGEFEGPPLPAKLHEIVPDRRLRR